MRTFCSVLLICSLKEIASAKLFWNKYEFTKDKRISNTLSSPTTSTFSACCTVCYMSGACDIAAYNRESRVCELGNKELGEINTETGWDLCAAKCPAGWEYFDNSCFMLETETLSWTAAQEKCNNTVIGGRLAYSKTEDKNEFLIRLVTRAYLEGFDMHETWIGGTRGELDMFYWGDSTPLSDGFTNWHPTEPSNNRGEEHCLAIQGIPEFKWNDGRCFHPMFSICEKEIN